MKTKKLTLNEAWKLCLKMWKWIANQKKKGGTEDAEDLKERWFEKHDFGQVHENCFFCEYALQHDGCKKACPGKIVSPRFSCTRETYHYIDNPIAFYNKLVSLNRKRQKRAVKKKK